MTQRAMRHPCPLSVPAHARPGQDVTAHACLCLLAHEGHDCSRLLDELLTLQVKHGALTQGTDLYKAKMSVAAASTYCGNNGNCLGFTWAAPQTKTPKEEDPMVFFKASLAHTKP